MAASPSPVGGDPVVAEQTVQWDTVCHAPGAVGFGMPPIPVSITSTAPEEASDGEHFEARFEVGPGFPSLPTWAWQLPDGSDPTVGPSDFALQDVQFTYAVPMHAVIEGAELVPGSWSGIVGEPSVAVDQSSLPARVVVTAPLLDGEAVAADTLRYPSVDVTLRPTGPVGALIAPRIVGGESSYDTGLRFLSSTTNGSSEHVCTFRGAGPHPVLTEILIVDGPEVVSTETEIRVLPGWSFTAGEDAQMRVLVTAPVGTVRLTVGDQVGEAELRDDGVAKVSMTMPEGGVHQAVAEYLGTATHQPSVSSPVPLLVVDAEPFADVGEDQLFVEAIGWLVAVGWTDGYPDGTFGPSAGVSRQAAAAILYRAAGAPLGGEPACDDAPFPDVPIDHPFCGEIAWLAEAGLATGYGDGTFAPARQVARQAMAAFLYRAAGSPDGPITLCAQAPFSDVPAGHAFCGEITWLVDEGFAVGYEGDEFRPAWPVTRQALASYLYGLHGPGLP